MTDNKNFLAMEVAVLDVIKTVYDPEIPVDIYALGLIYKIDVDEDNNVEIKMTLTAPNCPMAEELIQEVNDKVKGIKDVKEVTINLVFDPPWDKSMMSEEALLELGML
ncbi:MAG: iron-sulfur cluster assembly protein [Bacteroidales bacterium]|jgi:FeS assembly SUF system protein|nr:iron-sulfur cluster assembly protein [Bacteroidales bacterium]